MNSPNPPLSANPTLMTDCDGAMQKAKQMHDAADEYDRQAAKLHTSGALAAAMNPGFSSALQMQASGVSMGKVSTTIAARIRAQADELTKLVNETRAGNEDAAKKLRQLMQPAS
jgi:hypothetical protein